MKRFVACTLALLLASPILVGTSTAGASTTPVVNGTWASVTAGSTPVGVAADASGNIYVDNLNSNNVAKVAKNGSVTQSFASVLDSSYPYYIAVTASGTVYVAENTSHVVAKFTSTSSNNDWVGTLSGSPGQISIGPDGSVYFPELTSGNIDRVGPGENSSTVIMQLPNGDSAQAMILSTNGYLYAAGRDSGKIYKIKTDGSTVEVVGTATSMHESFYMALGPDGSVYIANKDTDLISKVSPTDVWTENWAALPAGSGPVGLAVDPAGNVYAGNNNFNFVSKISPDGIVTAQWAALPGPTFGMTFSGSSLFVSLPGQDAVARITIPSSPTITSMTPVKLRVAGGTRLTITGTWFVKGASVTIGGKACTSVAFVSSSTLTCKSPAHRSGSQAVVVKNPDHQTARGTIRYS